MAHYDKSTMDFMEKVADGVQGVKPLGPPKPTDEIVEDAARKSLSSLRGLRSGGALGMAATALMPMAAEKLFSKFGSLSVLTTYNYLNNIYDQKWWDWEPETLWNVLEVDNGIDATDEIKNLVMALQTVLKSNAAHEHWHIFENVCQAFNGNSVDFSTVQPAELNEIALTIKILNHLRPKQAFDEEVFIYIAASARNSGVVFLPSDLFPEECQKFLNEMGFDTLLLRSRVQKSWPETPKKEFAADLQIQLARLHEIKEYVEEHHG